MPRHSLSSYGRQAFAVAGPTAWNSLSDDLSDRHLALTVSDICLKLGCFQSTGTYSTLKVSHFMRYIKSRLTYILTYKCYHYVTRHAVQASTKSWTLTNEAADRFKLSREFTEPVYPRLIIQYSTLEEGGKVLQFLNDHETQESIQASQTPRTDRLLHTRQDSCDIFIDQLSQISTKATTILIHMPRSFVSQACRKI